MNNLEFRIKKISYSCGEDIDLSAIPMMMRRKLSPVGKIAMSTLLKCYDNEDVKLVYASRYGELERVVKLINKNMKKTKFLRPDLVFRFTIQQ